MPIYEYQCPACEHDFEQLVRSANDEPAVCCPKCGGRRIARKLSVFAARSGAAQQNDAPAARGCMRCGDPNGPCGAE